MNPEELQLYKDLQSLFKEKMREWQVGDRAYRKCTVFGEELDSKIWSDDKRTEIITIRGQSSIESYWHCVNKNGEERTLTDQDLYSETCLRLPYTINDQNPKRGLTGFLTDKGIECLLDRYVTSLSAFLNDPDKTLEILKALKVQEMIKG